MPERQRVDTRLGWSAGGQLRVDWRRGPDWVPDRQTWHRIQGIREVEPTEGHPMPAWSIRPCARDVGDGAGG
ncbi:hypothetical protein BN12_1230007 [Nostocoides japonicum T1-X7]|uniref:Uncharacterized protein n=1 Tax=Nostocoides japonicum T1-X7 TaxID=1194083 RepID=A0A077LWJ0_9MICO|nr:hypothetical protein BN12_1230007 [Tetrasphaera japonica T1-X7]